MAPSTTKAPLMVSLKLSPSVLSKFPHEVKPSPPTKSKASSSSDTPAATIPKPVVEEDASAPPSDPSGTPAPNGSGNDPSTPSGADGAKRKGVPGPKPGMKRNASQLDVNGQPKAKGKPGPKKKARLDGAEGDGTPGATTAPAAPAQKLGPKANLGVINEKLRALDRTGTPCRKWQRKGFTVKSFTGVMWDVHSTWAAHRKPAETEFAGDVKSEESSGGLSEGKAAGSGMPGSSAVGSENGMSNADGGTPLATNGDAGAVIAAA